MQESSQQPRGSSGPRVMIDMRPRATQPIRRVVKTPRTPALSNQTTARLPQRTASLPRPAPASPRRSKRRLRAKIVACAIGIALIGWVLTSHRTVTEKAAAAAPSKLQTICLDPGHGGDDPGASNNDITERDINLTVALAVRDLLQHQGYRVYMTRTSNDPTLSNADRYHYCNDHKATIMVSIHHNYFSDPSVDYDSSLFFKPEDQALATDIVAATSAKLGLDNNGVASFEDGVLSESTMPAALSEGFFITNSTEYAQLTAPGSTRLADEADGIYTGILAYFAHPEPTPTPSGAAPPPTLNRAD
jgi:N-acetylmuramoyl-L-alanine amidase